MHVPVEHPRFESHRLSVEPAGFFSAAKLLLDERYVQGKKRKYEVQDDSGRPTTLQLKPSVLDPIPKLLIDGDEVSLARPLRWYEYAWMALPVLMVFAGGALGVLFGLLACHVNSRILRADRAAPLRYVMSGVVSVTAAVVFFVAVTVGEVAIKGSDEFESSFAKSFVEKCVAGGVAKGADLEWVRGYCECFAHGLTEKYSLIELPTLTSRFEDEAFVGQLAREFGCIKQ